ncbi:hypothetical protein [Porphyromonas gulae]|uniref:hypothetical protein n=1 Tax=Porphyromonas gulae TaxID=111105 RepID=UPI0026EEE84F|nr:hypothetical protein [Porphyromonas gulae]
MKRKISAVLVSMLLGFVANSQEIRFFQDLPVSNPQELFKELEARNFPKEEKGKFKGEYVTEFQGHRFYLTGADDMVIAKYCCEGDTRETMEICSELTNQLERQAINAGHEVSIIYHEGREILELKNHVDIRRQMENRKYDRQREVDYSIITLENGDTITVRLKPVIGLGTFHKHSAVSWKISVLFMYKGSAS